LGGLKQLFAFAQSCRPTVGVVAGGVAADFHGRTGAMVGGGYGGAVIAVAVLFQPAPAGSSVCEFRTPDRHRLPGLDQAVVPA
jgi:hypothetical protein